MRDDVKAYYGSTLTESADLRTDACCTVEDTPAWLGEALERIHPEVRSRYYGCGLLAPDALAGMRILDLGCGSGRDCYLLSQLVGEDGEVVGVDMTPEQLAVARDHQEFHREAFGYARSNVRFELGYIESLDELGLEPGSFDVIVSNCVLNLSPDKAAVLEQAHRLLRPGGEMYFADVYSERRVPEALRGDRMLVGECLAGALYWNDFLQLAKAAGFLDPRLVTHRPIAVEDPAIRGQLGDLRFHSATYRLFRIDELEPACEDYGEAVRYRGTLPDQPEAMVLDAQHRFPAGEAVRVCGNSRRMLSESRFAPHFEFMGEGSVHLGIFEGCGSAMPFAAATAARSSCC